MVQLTDDLLAKYFDDISKIELYDEMKRPERGLERRLFYILKDPELVEYAESKMKKVGEDIIKNEEMVITKTEKLKGFKERYRKLEDQIDDKQSQSLEEKINKLQSEINFIIYNPSDFKAQDIIVKAYVTGKTSDVEFKYKVEDEWLLFPLDEFLKVKGIEKLVSILPF